MPVKIVTDITEFEQLREKWNALVETSVYPNIFTTWEWSFLWWKHFGASVGRRGGSLFILLVENDDPDGELLAIFPLYRTGNGRLIYWIGYGAKLCPEYLGPLIRHDAIEIAVLTVCDFLVNDAGRWDRFFFEDYARDDPGTSAFAERLKQKLPNRAASGEARFYVSLPDSYDAYLKRFSGHNRMNKKNRLNKSKSAYLASTEVVTAGDLERGFFLLADLTTQSRKRLKQVSPYLQESYRAFHREILETLLPMNRAMLFLLKYADTPVAVLFSYTLNRKCYATQLGWISDCPGSPGDLIFQYMLIHLIENRFSELDFLRGGQWYKTTFTDTSRPTETLSVYYGKNFTYLCDRMKAQLYYPVKRIIKLLLLKLSKIRFRKNRKT